MAEKRPYHISSAIVVVRTEMREQVQARLALMDGVEVHAAEGGKIVVVIEGGSTGALGGTLSEMALLDGVVAANMVFEHIELEETIGNDKRTDAA